MFGQEAKLAVLINKDPPQLPNEAELVGALRLKLGPGADPEKLLFQIRNARGKTHWAVNSYLRDVMSSRPAPGQEDFHPTRPARAAAAAAAVAAADPAAAAAAANAANGATAAAEHGASAGAECGCGRCGRHSGGSLPGDCGGGGGTDSRSAAVAVSAGALPESGGPAGSAVGESSGGDPGSCACSGGIVPASASGPGLESLPVSLLEAVFRWVDYRSLAAAALVCRATAAAAASDALWRRLYAERWGAVQFPVEPAAGGRGAAAPPAAGSSGGPLVPHPADGAGAAASGRGGAEGPLAPGGSPRPGHGRALQADLHRGGDRGGAEPPPPVPVPAGAASVARACSSGPSGGVGSGSAPRGPGRALELRLQAGGCAGAGSAGGGGSSGACAFGSGGTGGNGNGESVGGCAATAAAVPSPSTGGASQRAAASGAPPGISGPARGWVGPADAAEVAAAPLPQGTPVGVASSSCAALDPDADAAGGSADADAGCDAGSGGAAAGGACGRAAAAATAASGGTDAAAQGGVSSCARRRYAAQMSFLTRLVCPRCGCGPIVPIVYGFPSPVLMEGMRSRRLVLGGDHLIEDCHVWACPACAASFRAFPYDHCAAWLADLARPPPSRRPGEMAPYTYEL